MDRRDFLKASAAATLTLAADPTWAQSAKTEIHWLGQATTKITTPSGKVIVIDPWLVNNPKTPAEYKNLDKLGKVDVILVTHAHGDHVGTLGRGDGTSDTADLAKRTGAKVFGPAGLIQTMLDLGWVTGEQGVRFGKGGTVTPLGPQVKITQVRAEHSSELTEAGCRRARVSCAPPFHQHVVPVLVLGRAKTLERDPGCRPSSRAARRATD